MENILKSIEIEHYNILHKLTTFKLDCNIDAKAFNNCIKELWKNHKVIFREVFEPCKYEFIQKVNDYTDHDNFLPFKGHRLTFRIKKKYLKDTYLNIHTNNKVERINLSDHLMLCNMNGMASTITTMSITRYELGEFDNFLEVLLTKYDIDDSFVSITLTFKHKAIATKELQ